MGPERPVEPPALGAEAVGQIRRQRRQRGPGVAEEQLPAGLGRGEARQHQQPREFDVEPRGVVQALLAVGRPLRCRPYPAGQLPRGGEPLVLGGRCVPQGVPDGGHLGRLTDRQAGD